MKIRKSTGKILMTAGTVAVLGLMLSAQQTLALPVDLGAAGPGNWAVLEIGTGDLDIEVNAGGPVNGVTGNVGLNGIGQLKLTGTTFVQGDVVVAQNVNQVVLSGAAAITGSIAINQALLTQAHDDALKAAADAAVLPSSGAAFGTAASRIDITTGGTIHSGVYYVDKFELSNNEFLHLADDGSYVFNISGDLKINGPGGVLLDGSLGAGNVLFNYTGTTTVAFAGGSYPDGSEKAVLYGIILAPDAAVSLAPGQVFGEIISGKKISIVSGSDVSGTTQVPDAGSTMLLMSIGLGALAAAKRKFVS